MARKSATDTKENAAEETMNEENDEQCTCEDEEEQSLFAILVECAGTCESTFYNHCMGQEEMKRCGQLCVDCSDICVTTAKYAARDSEQLPATAAVCAEVCDACAEECEQFEDEAMELCAEVCRDCADVCREVTEE